MGTAVLEQATAVRQRCLATRWENSFVAAWTSTKNNASKRYTRIEKIMTMWSKDDGKVDDLVPCFFSSAQKVMQDGEPTPSSAGNSRC